MKTVLLCKFAYFRISRTYAPPFDRFKGRIHVPGDVTDVYSDFGGPSEFFIFLLHPNAISDFRPGRLFERFTCFSFVF